MTDEAISAQELQKIALAVVFAFLFPVVPYLLSRVWESTVNRTFGTRSNVTDRRILNSFYLAFPVIILGITVQVFFDTLQTWWIESPYIVSLLGFLFLVATPVLLLIMIIRLWRSRSA